MPTNLRPYRCPIAVSFASAQAHLLAPSSLSQVRRKIFVPEAGSWYGQKTRADALTSNNHFDEDTLEQNRCGPALKVHGVYLHAR